MRRTSIISMIVAGVIIIAGIIVCAVGGAYAKKDNYMLFPEVENGESVYRHDFTEEEVSRINVAVEAADVYFTRGGESSYIEIRNFNSNYYKLSTENNLISFTEVTDVMSMFKFWEGGFSFKGMRYIFRLDTNSDEGRRVTVNLAEGTEIPAISVDAEAGKVSLADISLSSEVTLNLGAAAAELNAVSLSGTLAVSSETGSLTVMDSAFSKFLISGKSCDAVIDGVVSELCHWEMKAGDVDAADVQTAEFAVNTDAAKVSASGLLADRINAKSTSGQLILGLADALGTHSAELTSKSGSIFVDGVHYTGTCSLPGTDEARTITVVTDSASVSVEGAE